MIRGGAPYFGKRFIGDTATNVVHDSLFERQMVGPTCNIDAVKLDCVRTFSPDTLDQAKAEGYKPCKGCLFLETPIV